MFIKIGDLKPGMVCDELVCSGDLVLLEIGTVLTEDLIDQLFNYGISGIETNSSPLGKIKAEEAKVHNELTKEYKKSIENTKVAMQKFINEEVDVEEVNSIVEDTLNSLDKDMDIFLSIVKSKGEDNYLYSHALKSSMIALSIGKKLNYSDEKLKILGRASLLHDIGMFKIDESIIMKKTITTKEYEIIKTHTQIGYEMVTHENEIVRDTIRDHHEKVNGTGYPGKKLGMEIDEITKVVSIADVYAAMISDRPYRKAKTPRNAIKEMMKISGEYFDIGIFKVFLETISVFPVGEKIELNNKAKGVVVRSTTNPFRPVVDVTTKNDKLERVDLTETKYATLYITGLF